MFEGAIVQDVNNFIILLLVNISVEISFLMHSGSLLENKPDVDAVVGGFFLTECVLRFVCSTSFEKNTLAADNNFIYKVFCSLKNVVRTVYGFLTDAGSTDEKELS